jgi:hypothetical protein
MNSPHSLLPSAAFNSWMSFLLNPANTAKEETFVVTENRMGTTDLKAENRRGSDCQQARLTMQHIELLGTAVPDIISAIRPCFSRIGSYRSNNILDLESTSTFIAVRMLQD